MAPLQTQTRAQDEEEPKPEWKVTGEAYSKYAQYFETMAKDVYGRATGRDVAQFLTQSGLNKPVIAGILELADIDRDTMFDCDEFAVAMHLALIISKRGFALPDRLPLWLVPKSKRHGA